LTICREWSLVKQTESFAEAKSLKCRSWGCEECQPVRRRQLMAQAASGDPTRFITLTANPREGVDPEDRLKRLSHAWAIVVKRIRRMHPGETVSYLAVVEATKAGEPHLHILFRGPWVAQKWLSSVMHELANAPIVDVRRIKDRQQVVNYVAKYIAKKPAQFGTSKRYWQTPDYQLEKDEETVFSLLPDLKYAVWGMPLIQVAQHFTNLFFAGRRGPRDTLHFFAQWDPLL